MNHDTKNLSLCGNKNLRYIDSHCHLAGLDSYTGEEDRVVERARNAGVVAMITIGIDVASSKAAVDVAQKYPYVFAAIGIHPNNTEGVDVDDYKELERVYGENRRAVKGFGEIGLDYYRNRAAPDVQKRHFAGQLEVAERLNLPVIIHNRDATDDCLAVLGGFKREAGCVMHCFSGNYATAKKVLDMGMYISFSGVVTFKNAPELHEVAKKIPLERMLVETDAPFLAPTPFRGKRNEPSYLPYTAAKIAQLRGIDVEEAARVLYDNTVRFFRLNDLPEKTSEND